MVCPSCALQLYLLLLFLRVLLSWFPTFQWWDQQPWLALRQVGGWVAPANGRLFCRAWTTGECLSAAKSLC